jgi:hypothetical protein
VCGRWHTHTQTHTHTHWEIWGLISGPPTTVSPPESDRWIEDNCRPGSCFLRLWDEGANPGSQNQHSHERCPPSLVWKALDINESGVVLCLALLPANWVCRNNLNLHFHVASLFPWRTLLQSRLPLLFTSRLAKGFVLLGTWFCWCTICYSTFLSGLIDHTIIWCFFRGAWRRFGGEEKDL